ncbi:threonine/serine dehydratase [Ilumatobacter nonamiensis]|uniref:threonine/serine dehydratase n=1 Tax=Ilumatobacter nonamiensis TaxID=467093 RepID=UPI00034CD9EB|nr:threonine/serine dehydratase [Ilumatobacter nonamiensis]
MTTDSELTIDAIEDAAQRIQPDVHRTGVLHSAAIDALAGRRVHLKAEHLQRSGSFKARGAHNKLRLILDAARRHGVVAVSSGNHATAVACAGQRLGIPVDVYMPRDAPALKQRATRGYGARIHFFDRLLDDRAQLIDAHVEAHGSIAVEPFDDVDIMAGQGTVAYELLTQSRVDTLVVPMSGGGLMAGCAVAACAAQSDITIIGVEPAVADDTARSFAKGDRVEIPQPITVADGLAVTAPGRLTFPINQRLVDRVVTVSDQQIIDTCVLLFERCKQVVEPSGATALAAVLAGLTGDADDVGVVMSGGNIDVTELAALVAAHPPPSDRR